MPPDYKFFCFNGNVGFVQIDEDRFSGHTRAILLPDGGFVAASIAYPMPTNPPKRPANFAQMLDVAERLATGMDFVRVDLYNMGDRIVFGELTNYPEAGTGKMEPEELFTELSRDWRPQDIVGPWAKGTRL